MKSRRCRSGGWSPSSRNFPNNREIQRNRTTDRLPEELRPFKSAFCTFSGHLFNSSKNNIPLWALKIFPFVNASTLIGPNFNAFTGSMSPNKSSDVRSGDPCTRTKDAWSPIGGPRGSDPELSRSPVKSWSGNQDCLRCEVRARSSATKRGPHVSICGQAARRRPRATSHNPPAGDNSTTDGFFCPTNSSSFPSKEGDSP